MRIVKNLIIKRVELAQERELHHEYIKAIWYFYSAYNFCKQIMNLQTKEKIKNSLMKKALEGDKTSINKLVLHMRKDHKIINQTIEYLGELEEKQEIHGDVYKEGMIGVSVEDE